MPNKLYELVQLDSKPANTKTDKIDKLVKVIEEMLKKVDDSMPPAQDAKSLIEQVETAKEKAANKQQEQQKIKSMDDFYALMAKAKPKKANTTKAQGASNYQAGDFITHYLYPGSIFMVVSNKTKEAFNKHWNLGLNIIWCVAIGGNDKLNLGDPYCWPIDAEGITLIKLPTEESND